MVPTVFRRGDVEVVIGQQLRRSLSHFSRGELDHESRSELTNLRLRRSEASATGAWRAVTSRSSFRVQAAAGSIPETIYIFFTVCVNAW